MRASILLLLAVIGVACFACQRAEKITNEAVERDEIQFQNALRTLRDVAARAESVEIYHVANQFDADYAQIAERTKARFANYPVRAQITVPKERIAPIVTVLTERTSYFPPDQAWTCLFEPRHVLHFAAQNNAVTAVVCIACGDVVLIVGKESTGTRSVRPAANGELARMLTGIFGSQRTDG